MEVRNGLRFLRRLNGRCEIVTCDKALRSQSGSQQHGGLVRVGCRMHSLAIKPLSREDRMATVRLVHKQVDPGGPPTAQEVNPLPPPGMLTRNLCLRPVLGPDLPRLYDLSISPTNLYTWRFTGETPTYDQFVKSFDNGVHCQMAVAGRANSELRGHVMLYKASLRHKHAYCAIMLDLSAQRFGLGIEAMFAFLYHCFSVWPFEKIYFESIEPNWIKIRSGASRGLFAEEGRLRHHAFVQGRLVDVYIGAIYRDTLNDNEFVRRVLTRTLVPDTRRSILPSSPTARDGRQSQNVAFRINQQPG